MTVVPLQALPLGFRFHPTDEELVNHYLKRKINGRIRSDIEVIPEIDICKCEPWDLPDKSLIRSDDPEWFFFSPKDRKYPSGHRSNRATEAGYWKATGKDRLIKSKAPAAPAVIGMKKSLVFHRGRAPKGVRTNWIMHEYRATEPEFESGEQGGYVLYRLFRKPEEKSSSANGDGIERSGLSPSPTDTNYEADNSEELGTPMAATPLNHVSPVSVSQNPPSLSHDSKDQTSNITRWLADNSVCSSLKPEDGHCNVYRNPEQEAETGAVVDPLVDALEQLCNHEDEQRDSNWFPSITSPMRPYSNHPFLGITDEKSPTEFCEFDCMEQDSMDELLNSILNDEYSPEINIPQVSASDIIHSRSGSEIETEGGAGFNDPNWFCMDNSVDFCNEINSIFNQNANLVPCDNTAPDMYSLDSGAESMQELFSMQDSNGHMNNAHSSGDNLETTGTSGIKIRSRQPRHPIVDNLSAEQGLARRRIRLQCSDQIREAPQSESSSNEEYNDDLGATVEVGGNDENDDIPKDRSTSLSCSLIVLQDGGPFLELQSSSSQDDTTASSNVEEASAAVPDIAQESVPKLRLRTKSTKEVAESNNLKASTPETKKTPSTSGVMGFVLRAMIVMAILVFLCVWLWRWEESSSLVIGGGFL